MGGKAVVLLGVLGMVPATKTDSASRMTMPACEHRAHSELGTKSHSQGGAQAHCLRAELSVWRERQFPSVLFPFSKYRVLFL